MMMKGDDADEKEEEGLEMMAAWDDAAVEQVCRGGGADAVRC